MRKIRKNDLTFHYADPLSTLRRDIDAFVRELEPTGTLPQRPTHHFCATTRLNRIVSAQILAVPEFKTPPILGEGTYHLERYFARGATKQNYKKNIPSWMISRTIDWLIKNTEYRIFYGYACKELNEFGKVYKASNWIHLGDHFGNTNNPPKSKWLYFKGSTPGQTQELTQRFQDIYLCGPKTSDT